MYLRKILVGSAGLGTGLMYLLDRQAGRRRRAAIRDKAVHGAHVTTDTAEKTTRDIRNRLQGIGAEVKHIFSREKVSDKVLVDRIRSDIGTVVSHPGSVQVEAINGHVKLTGVVLAAELENLLKRVESVRGVRDVVHELEVHEKPGNVPGLQGEGSGRLFGGRFELMQENWSPAARAITGTAGGVMVIYGLINRRLSGAAAVAAGLPLFARAATNMPLRRIVEAAGRRGVDIEKTINIDAPVERVFEILSRVEDFPKFMRHVKKVSKVEPKDRYRWTVSGPAGVDVSWDSDFTSIVPNRQLAWRTAPRSMVKHAGIVRFDANPDETTAVNIHLTYNPLIGGLGHVLLTMLGSDPKTLLDEDLLRAKTFLETGKQPRDAAARRSD